MGRRAVLVFADNLGLDLSRRQLPAAAARLLEFQRVASEISGADVHLFTSCALVGAGKQVHAQTGATFAERLENAVESLAQMGYSEIVAIGRDCPQLTGHDIEVAFEQLSANQLVLGPDHRGGCYLIGLRSTERHLLRGIRWNRNTDRAELTARCGASGVFLLPVKQDVDSWADLRLLARGGDRIARIAARLIALASDYRQALDQFVDLAAQHVRVRGQMPPPALVG